MKTFFYKIEKKRLTNGRGDDIIIQVSVFE